jgi:citrate/tricarballylate utilization protein
MEICNACRYCEGYCAVFPAMELRRAFSDADLSYLANLCHDCRACFHACQYAPPHEFGINLPRTFAELRAETYAQYAWPAAMGRVFQRNGALVALASGGVLALVLLLALLLQSPGTLYTAHHGAGAFYRVIPLALMVAAGAFAFVYALLALGMGFARFWRDAGGPAVGPRQLARALADAATLRNLGGGGDGCNDLDDAFSNTRRWLHHATAYGFALCFAATCVAFVYHEFLGWVAPYAFASAPVLLGTLGGIGLLIGTSGLFAMKLAADPAPAARNLLGMDTALLLLLALVAASGLLLLGLRATGAMGVLLAVHLGFVLALFLVLPYGKFVHAAYRLGALLRYAGER